ncbi:hypothetical protein [Thiothrix nivea]|uniref:Uncharacterized protein n=1 Tax=Thiothrix nivea (strain ATCC 35100 / DSM 5205 / JP2) TaxID=870187 RepID=A0A656HFI0_THINJ|nr:hypothetical protein [Thiothrix nivea]EIJ34952.1 hypothetical protein Thini_2398 [Thiothrix nivea DSM 5205]
MAMVSPAGSHVILENRYVLLECLAVSGVGKVYRGRDLEQIKAKGLESRILIHVLPVTPNALPLDMMFQQMLGVCQHLEVSWILKPQAYGQDGNLAYFVLESPEKWGLFSLLSRTNRKDPVWQAAMQRLQPLVKQQHLGTNTDPALLLGVSAEEIYLLPTAFSPLVQVLGGQEGFRRVIHHGKHKAAVVVGSVLGLSTIFSAVAANAIFQQKEAVVVEAVLPAPAPQTQIPVRVAAIPATDRVDSPVTGMQATLKDEALSLVGEPPLASTMTQPPAKPDKAMSPSEGAMQKTVPPPPEPKQQLPLIANANKASRVIPEPASVQEAPHQPPNGVDGLIQQAYAAMGAGRLDVGKAGALYYARQLRALSPQHPQVARLGQEISAAYLRQVRAALQSGNLAAAGQWLPLTRQLIQEFGLTNLEPAQQVLEEKVAQLNSY